MAAAGSDPLINQDEVVIVHTPAQLPIRRAVIVMVAIVVATALIWLIAGLTYMQYMPSQLSLLVISYTLGLRHALDADHVAAIDNVTRRFTQEGKSYLTVGTYFSLGHSTIVMVATVLVAALSSTIAGMFNQYNTVSGSIGSIIAATFLFLIATINGVCMVLLVRDIRRERNRMLRQVQRRKGLVEGGNADAEAEADEDVNNRLNRVNRKKDRGDVELEAGLPQLPLQLPQQPQQPQQPQHPQQPQTPQQPQQSQLPQSPQLPQLPAAPPPEGDPLSRPSHPSHPSSISSDDDDEAAMRWDQLLENSGFLTRLFGQRLFALIDRPWKMYYVGFLFGLGFDTATEIAFLGIAALQAVSGTPSWLILFLPLLFTVGMVLIDTADGILMSGEWVN